MPDATGVMVYQAFHSIGHIAYISRSTVLVGYYAYFLSGFQTVFYQLENIAMLPRQGFAINNDYTDYCIIATFPCNRQLPFIFGDSVIVNRSRNIGFRITLIFFTAKHTIRR